LSSWHEVEQVLHNDERLRSQMDTLVGTSQGGSRFDAETASQCVLPLPDEVGDLEATFARSYDRLDGFLAAREIGLVVVCPIPGLTSNEFPIVLEPDLELDLMSDGELTAALNTEVLPLMFLTLPLLPPEQSKQACLRYRYSLPKVIGDSDHEQAAAQFQEREERLRAVRETLEQVLALVFANPVAISGVVNLGADWTLHSAGVTFQPLRLTHVQRRRQSHLDEQTAAEVVATWRLLRQPGFLQRQKALALALRRLGYQAGRERVEDELVDILIAAEALYLSDVDYEELGFRLALRTAALCDPEALELTRRDVFDLMRSAYRVRSKVVHGEAPKSKDLKVKGVQASLADFVQAIEDVIRQGLGEALRRAVDPKGKWPPDWDDMIVPK
jgi:hypothetical protein